MSHQAIMERINNLTDDGVELIDQIIDSLNPKYFIVQPDEIGGVDVKKRIGAGKGLIGNTDHFDDCNDEIAKMRLPRCFWVTRYEISCGHTYFVMGNSR